MAAYRQMDGLKLPTCGLTACTPGSAPGPVLGNKYERTLPLPPITQLLISVMCLFVTKAFLYNKIKYCCMEYNYKINETALLTRTDQGHRWNTAGCSLSEYNQFPYVRTF